MLVAGLAAVSGLFVAGLLAKHLLNRRFCVVCASVSLTWLGLLGLYYFDLFDDTILLAILMGQSITGLYYFIDKKVAKSLRIFSLPFLLSLTAAVYMLIKTEIIIAAFVLLLAAWLVCWLIFSLRVDSVALRFSFTRALIFS